MMRPCRRTPLYQLGPMRVIFTSVNPAFVNHSMYSDSLGNSIHMSAKNLLLQRMGTNKQHWEEGCVCVCGKVGERVGVWAVFALQFTMHPRSRYYLISSLKFTAISHLESG